MLELGCPFAGGPRAKGVNFKRCALVGAVASALPLKGRAKAPYESLLALQCSYLLCSLAPFGGLP